MASTKSGAKQTLSVGGVTVSGEDSGFTGLVLSQRSANYTTSSGGVTKVEDGSHRVNTGSFSCNETPTTNQALLGQNGARKAIAWNDGEDDHSFNAILRITHNGLARAQRTYAVDLIIDGAIT